MADKKDIVDLRLAPIAGLEKSKAEDDRDKIDLTAQHREMGCAFRTLSDGIPMIYMGFEIALTHDCRCLDAPMHAQDNHWIHRPDTDRAKVADVQSGVSPPEASVFHGTHVIFCAGQGHTNRA